PELRKRCGQNSKWSSTPGRLPAQRIDCRLVVTRRILRPSLQPEILARREWIQRERVAHAFEPVEGFALEHPEVREQRPGVGMVGIEPQRLFELGHPLGELKAISAQVTQR